MKYDSELFELSDYFKTVNKHEKDSKDIEIKKRKLFRLILDKFRQSEKRYIDGSIVMLI